ncbi:uncharacterized protein LOC144264177 [Eretmochelys imbricata]
MDPCGAEDWLTLLEPHTDQAEEELLGLPLAFYLDDAEDPVQTQGYRFQVSSVLHGSPSGLTGFRWEGYDRYRGGSGSDPCSRRHNEDDWMWKLWYVHDPGGGTW